MGACCCIETPQDVLGRCTDDNTEQFVINFAHAKVVRVVDGDTVVCAFRLKKGMAPRKVSCRLIGIDTPENHPKKLNRTQKGMAIERKCAQDATARMTALVLDKMVRIECVNWRKNARGGMSRVADAYGRPLIKITVGRRDVNQTMLKEGLACTTEQMPWYRHTKNV